MWRQAAVLALLLTSGCHSAAQTPVAAVITDPSALTIAELEDTISDALAGRRVTLTADAFAHASVLTLEPAIHQTPAGSLASGRSTQRPEQFQLLLTDQGCVLERLQTGERFELPTTRCAPAPSRDNGR